jgi:hypothetical protein
MRSSACGAAPRACGSLTAETLSLYAITTTAGGFRRTTMSPGERGFTRRRGNMIAKLALWHLNRWQKHLPCLHADENRTFFIFHTLGYPRLTAKCVKCSLVLRDHEAEELLSLVNEDRRETDIIRKAHYAVTCQDCGDRCEWTVGIASGKHMCVCQNLDCIKIQTKEWAGEKP